MHLCHSPKVDGMCRSNFCAWIAERPPPPEGRESGPGDAAAAAGWVTGAKGGRGHFQLHPVVVVQLEYSIVMI